ncbi:hypothetical protein BJX65DRAFT_312549 [Aspergillus insuetus]
MDVHRHPARGKVDGLVAHGTFTAYTRSAGTGPNSRTTSYSDTRSVHLEPNPYMNSTAFSSTTMFSSGGRLKNTENNNDIGRGIISPPEGRLGYSSADAGINSQTCPTDTLSVYIQRLYLSMPIFDVVDVQQNLLQMPPNLPARRHALLLAIKAAAHAYSRFSADHEEEYNKRILTDAIRASKQYDVVEQEDNYSLEGLLGSFFLFIACWNSNNQTSAWWYLRESIGLALARRLNQQVEYQKFTAQEGERKRRIFWTLIVAERTFCLMHDKPIMLQTNIVVPCSLSPRNGPVSGLVCCATLFQRLVFDSSGCWTAGGFVTPITLRDYGDDEILSLDYQLVGHLLGIQRLEYLITLDWLRAKMWKLGSPQLLSSSEFIASNGNPPWQLGQPLVIGSHVLEALQSSIDVLAFALSPVLDQKLHTICACIYEILPIMQTIRPGVSGAILRGIWEALCKPASFFCCSLRPHDMPLVIEASIGEKFQVRSRARHISESGKLYTLVRLSVSLQELHIFQLEIIRYIADIPSIELLNDGSFELVTRKTDLPTVRVAVRKLFLNARLDEDYDPLKPTGMDVAFWGLLSARKMVGIWFYRRALRIIQTGDMRAAMYYRHLLDVNGLQRG